MHGFWDSLGGLLLAADSPAAAQGEISWWGWGAFGATVAALLLLDLWSHRGARAESRGWAITWTVIWVVAGLAFCGYVWWRFSRGAAVEYLAAYMMEKSLSLDNLFVFLIIFNRLRIPQDHQRTALTWGVFGALVFRAIFIFLGAAALHRWEWVEYIFAVILIYAAWHAFREDPHAEEESRLIDWLATHLPVTKEPKKPHLWVVENGRRMVTPLLVAIIGLELTDVAFAIDSVPAAFSVVSEGPHQEFVVYSSNVFAILGLRSLYIVLAHTIAHLKYLHYGLAAVLAFAGLKMILAASDAFDFPPLASVGVIVVLIGAAVWASLRERRKHPERHRPQDEAWEQLERTTADR